MRLKKCSILTAIAFGRRAIRLVVLGVTGVALVSLMSACVPPADSGIGQQEPSTPTLETVEGKVDPEISPGTIPSREPRDCPDLDSQLFQLTQDDDPPASAEQLGFRVKDDKVQVLLILTSEETGFLEDFGVEVGTQSACQVQAFVPFDKLCELANTDAVLAIRPAAQAY